MLPDEVLKRVLKWVFHNGWKWKTSQNEDLHSSHYSFQPTVFEKSLDDGAKHFLMLREVSLRFRELIAESYFRLWHWQVDNTQRWYEWTRMTQGHLDLREHYTPGEMRLFFKSRVWSVWSVRKWDNKTLRHRGCLDPHFVDENKNSVRDDCLFFEDVERKPSEILAHPVLLRRDMPELNVPIDELAVQYWWDRQDAEKARREHRMQMRVAEIEEWRAQLPPLPLESDFRVRVTEWDTRKLHFQHPFEYDDVFLFHGGGDPGC